MPWSTALTKAWFEMIVPSGTSGLTTTSKTMVATLSGTPAFITPGVASWGALIRIPSIRGEAPAAASGTATPLSVVLPAT